MNFNFDQLNNIPILATSSPKRKVMAARIWSERQWDLEQRNRNQVQFRLIEK
jgi:hypothetical protein